MSYAPAAQEPRQSAFAAPEEMFGKGKSSVVKIGTFEL